jgi:hypothetical protein
MKTGSFSARIKCALVLIIFMLIPVIPVTGSVGLYVLIFRPIWFKKLVDKVYLDQGVESWFAEKAKLKGVNLQSLINELLRKDISLIQEVTAQG